ncbi:MaoC-like dehydratase [gamma proteobacterium HdN1]|nr:MaoC-like dehydratase [gamma proteobacterium HdN1]
MNYLENKTYDELSVGDSASFSRTLTQEDILLYAYVSGDYNPVHIDEEYAKTTQYKGTIAHGMFYAAMLSAAVASSLPGPGSILLSQEFRLRNPARAGDTLNGVISIAEKKSKMNIVRVDCTIKNQDGTTVFTGTSTVIAPSEKLKIAKAKLPQVTISL